MSQNEDIQVIMRRKWIENKKKWNGIINLWDRIEIQYNTEKAGVYNKIK